MNHSDHVTKLIKENQELRFINSVLVTKQAIYDTIFDYFKMTFLWFHSFILFFSSLQQNTSIPSSFLALNEQLFTMPEKIVEIHNTFLNNLSRHSELKSIEILKNDSVKLLNNDYDRNRQEINKAFTNINKFNNQLQLFDQFFKMDKQFISNVKHVLKIKNEIETESFLFNLKKIDILWNLVGTLFLKTPFLIHDSVSELKEFNNNFTLDHFVNFFENYFQKHFNCFLNKKHKLLIDPNCFPQLIFQEDNNIDPEMFKIIENSRLNKLLSDQLNSNFIEKHVNIAWSLFLQQIFKSNKTKTTQFFENFQNKKKIYVESRLIDVILKNLHFSPHDLIKNCFFSINKENILLKELLKFIAVNFIYYDNNNADNNLTITPILQIINRLKNYYESI